MKSRTMYFAPGGVSPGMTLAKAVTDREGHTLLVAGTQVDSEILERLIRRGVEVVGVLVADSRDEQTIADELVAARTRVETIFRGDGSPAKKGLHDAILNFRLESTK
ncbi:hypothetical protein [Propionivibrio sp.]|uniref:hypothetical protein n=1 Tax=Propionivibrio sp. TaxID=2212460 RepID=UPI003BF21BCA